MKTITFTYTKPDNSISERHLLVLKEPNTNYYAGLDLSEMDPEEAERFIRVYNEMHEEFLENVKALQAKFDIKHNYRQFLVERMSNVVEI